MPATLELGILSLIITNLISIPLGLFCAARPDSISDYTIRVIWPWSSSSVPVFWIGHHGADLSPTVWWGWAPFHGTYVPSSKTSVGES